jgi:hypothetical protein
VYRKLTSNILLAEVVETLREILLLSREDVLRLGPVLRKTFLGNDFKEPAESPDDSVMPRPDFFRGQVKGGRDLLDGAAFDPAGIKYPEGARRYTMREFVEHLANQGADRASLEQVGGAEFIDEERRDHRLGELYVRTARATTEEVDGDVAGEGPDPGPQAGTLGVRAEVFELDHDRKPDLLYTVTIVGLGEAAQTDVVPDHRVVTDIETVPGRRQVREWRQPLSALREVNLGVSKESKLLVLVVVYTGRMVKPGISCHIIILLAFLSPVVQAQ